ncbi:MAG TPA: hypothetical protein PKC20_20050, partial [Burkholderiaceae bacterium]|nr:hypothetical protein [Burkholderiaceae bacterium]
MVLGCGDVGLRFARAFSDRFRIVGVVRRDDARDAVRAAGAGLAPRVLPSAPPPPEGRDDPRTRRALVAMHRARVWIYLSTTGVYGDCGGAFFDETRAVAPRNDRAARRVAAERLLRRRAARGTIREAVNEVDPGDGVRSVSIKRTEPSGYRVVVRFDSADNLTRGLRRAGVENDMRDIY